jgi:hypothetical protein
VSTQMSLFEKTEVGPEKPEPRTTVRVGNRVAEVPLRKRRREALQKLMAILDQLEGKDVHISTYGGSGSHFWMNNLKLGRLRVDKILGDNKTPSVIVLWGSREASVRIFTDRIVNVREQEYQGFTLWLVDFWNGFGEYPIDPYRPKGYVSLNIVRFKD